jgi:hypothetical protein
MAGNQFKIPVYVKATTEDLLVKAMLENNLKGHTEYQYFDIQKRGKFWYAWYYKNIETEVKIEALGSK